MKMTVISHSLTGSNASLARVLAAEHVGTTDPGHRVMSKVVGPGRSR
jgi:hypothetical protein